MQHVGTVSIATAARSRLCGFRSLFSWMQHVGYPRVGTPYTLTAIAPACFDPCSPGCSTSASSSTSHLPGVNGFRSLFSWMQHVGWLVSHPCNRCRRRGFDPCSPGCSTSASLGRSSPPTNSRPVSILVLLDAARRHDKAGAHRRARSGFDPCSPGCSTSALPLISRVSPEGESFDPCSPGCSTSACGGASVATTSTSRFRSLFSWMQHVGLHTS